MPRRKSLGEAEEIARDFISNITPAYKGNVHITRTHLEDIGGEPVYNITGYARWIHKSGGFLGHFQNEDEVEQKFRIQIEASTGDVVGKTLYEPVYVGDEDEEEEEEEEDDDEEDSEEDEDEEDEEEEDEEDEDNTGWIIAYCPNCGKKIRHRVNLETRYATCTLCGRTWKYKGNSW